MPGFAEGGGAGRDFNRTLDEKSTQVFVNLAAQPNLQLVNVVVCGSGT